MVRGLASVLRVLCGNVCLPDSKRCDGERDASFVEKSAFVRREGRWLYHSAIEHSGPSRRSGRR